MSLKIDKSAAVKLDPEKVENGVIMDVLDLAGEKMFLGGDKDKPIQIRVRSGRCQAVKEADLKKQKMDAAVRGRRNPAAALEPNDVFIARRCAQTAVEFINFSAQEPVQRVSFKDAHDYFADPENEAVRDLVFAFGNDDANYAPDQDAPKKPQAEDAAAQDENTPSLQGSDA